MRTKKVVITAGGTGGHLYPAQGLAQQLTKESAPDLLFIGGGLGKNRCFDKNRFPFREIACSPLLSRNPLKCMRGIGNLIKGVCQSIAILKNYRPDVVVGFGSYYTASVILAARFLKIPIILHEANSVPGKANKWMASFASCIGVSFPITRSFFRGKTVEVDLPLREGYSLNQVEKQDALAYYGFSEHRHTLLICGGSQGAKAINQLIEQCTPIIKSLSLQVIHLTGDPVKANVLQNLYHSKGIVAVVKGHETEMHMAWKAASAFIGRSGASTIAEAIEFEVPGILIPYPHATDGHQEKNADFLVDDVQGAWKKLEHTLTPEILSSLIANLFDDNQLTSLKKRLQAHKRRPNQQTLSEVVQGYLT